MKKTKMKYKIALISFMSLSTLLLTMPLSANATHKPTDITAQGHVSNIGWQKAVNENQTVGTTGQARRLEAVKISLDKSVGGNVEYQAHVQNVGWQKWMKNGQIAGTTGRSLQVEAVKIRLTGEAAKKYDIKYRAHTANKGWMAWQTNGGLAGTTGQTRRLEAMQIVLVDKKDGSEKPNEKPKPPVEKPNPTGKVVIKFTDSDVVLDYNQKASVLDYITEFKDKQGNNLDKSKLKIEQEINTRGPGLKRMSVSYGGTFVAKGYTVKEEVVDKSQINLRDLTLEFGEVFRPQYVLHSMRDKDGNSVNMNDSKLVITGGEINTKVPGTYNVTFGFNDGGKATATATVTVKNHIGGSQTMLENAEVGQIVHLGSYFKEGFRQRLTQFRTEHISELKGDKPIVELPYDLEAEKLSEAWMQHDSQWEDPFKWQPLHTTYGIGAKTGTFSSENISDDYVLDQIINGFIASPNHYRSMLMDFSAIGTDVIVYKEHQDKTHPEINYVIMLVNSFRKPDGTLTEYPNFPQ